jgi:HSF-type DNA-binding
MQDSAAKGFESIVSWQAPVPGVASSFKVHNTHRFVDEIMPQYFKQTKFKSFQRQLNIYNFQRVHDGPNRGGYHHPYFVRNAPELLKLIPRKRLGNSQTAMDTKKDPPVPVHHAATTTNPVAVVASNPLAHVLAPSAPSPVSNMLLQALTAAANVGVHVGNNNNNNNTDHHHLVALLKAASANEEERQRMLQQSLLLLSAANTAGLSTHHGIQQVQAQAATPTHLSLPPGLMMTESAAAATMSTPPPPSSLGAVAAATAAASASNSNQHVFPWKLYKMLEEAPAKKFDHIVSWVQGGTAFKVHNAQGFLAEVIYQYFDQSKYESFRRQLNLYGFTRVVRGQHRGVYSHPFFRQGHQDWCRFITRQQPSQLLSSSSTGGGQAKRSSSMDDNDDDDNNDIDQPSRPPQQQKEKQPPPQQQQQQQQQLPSQPLPSAASNIAASATNSTSV